MSVVENVIAPQSPDAAMAGDLPTGDPEGVLLARVFALLARENVPYCVLHGYDDYPHRVRSDVDCLVARTTPPRELVALLKANQKSLGARLVQWFPDRAHFIVLELHPDGSGAPVVLQLHVSQDYEIEGLVVFRGEDVLATRREHAAGFWVPAVQVEFAAVLSNRIAKGRIEQRHARQLSMLWTKAPAACRTEIDRLLSSDHAALVAVAAESGEWSKAETVLPSMREQMLAQLQVHQPHGAAMRWCDKQLRRLRRWLSPRTGLHVVFLGPDGVGKSTVIETARERLAPAFLRSDYQTFARSLLPNKPKAGPHALPPRSFGASLLKAAWWLVCYTLGYYKSIYPKLAAGGLAINHRYFVDAIVDPKRYRYAGPMWLLRWVWAVSPKPDVIIFLDAPAEVIQKRKQETSPEETARQCEAYRALAATLPNARIVTTNQSVEQTIGSVTQIVLDHMNRRVNRRLRLK